MKITHKHEMKPYLHKYFKQGYGAIQITQMKFDVKRKIYSANLHGAMQNRVIVRQGFNKPYESIIRERIDLGVKEVSEETLKQYFNI